MTMGNQQVGLLCRIHRSHLRHQQRISLFYLMGPNLFYSVRRKENPSPRLCLASDYSLFSNIHHTHGSSSG